MTEVGNVNTLPTRRSTKTWKRRLLYLFLGLAVGTCLGLHYVPGPLLASALRGSVEDAGLRMVDPGDTALSLFSAHGHIYDVSIYKEKHAQALMAWDTLDFNLNVFDFLFSDSYTIESLTFDGLRINLRFPNEYTGDSAWLSYLNNLFNEMQTQLRQAPVRTQKSQLTIQSLIIHGDACWFPEPSPLDINSFTLQAQRQSSESVHTLIEFQAQAENGLSAEGSLRIEADATVFQITIKSIPSAVLTQHSFTPSFDTIFNSLRPSGSCDLELYHMQSASEQSGSLRLSSENMLLDPNPQPETLFTASFMNLAERMRLLRSLNPQELIQWEMTWKKVGEAAPVKNYGISRILGQLNERISQLKAVNVNKTSP